MTFSFQRYDASYVRFLDIDLVLGNSVKYDLFENEIFTGHYLQINEKQLQSSAMVNPCISTKKASCSLLMNIS